MCTSHFMTRNILSVIVQEIDLFNGNCVDRAVQRFIGLRFDVCENTTGPNVDSSQMEYVIAIMRWKIATILIVALVTATCGQHLTIDYDLTALEPPKDVLRPPHMPNDTLYEGHLLDIENIYPNRDISEEDVVLEVFNQHPENMILNKSEDIISVVKSEENGVSRSNENTLPKNNNVARNVALIANTTNGLVQGYSWNEMSNILGYIDIPYGKFSGPFEIPTFADSWVGVHQISEHNKRCPQMQSDAYVGEHDCLTLSIFTPVNIENASVLFHIHESNFISGSGDPSIYGPEYLVPKGIILVLPNYRLGPLGFLCLQNETALGNAALKDLTLALRWVRQNIKAFGGNPSNIVVSGDGTAGALVGYLALSPRSKTYISKVITESGSVLSHWALDRKPIASATKLAQIIGENGSYDNTFQEADVSTIVKAAKDIKLNPCLERNTEPFMEDTPWRMLQNQDINITFMIGSASHAGTREALETPKSSISQFNDDFGLFLPVDLKFKNCVERSEIGGKLKAQYFGEEDIRFHHVEKLSLCYTDASYLGPGIRAARLLVGADATVYFFEFAFVGSLNRELESMNRTVQGAARNDIVGYLFTQGGKTPDDDTDEKHMISLMVDLWVSFINTGKPTAENIEWNELKTSEESEEECLLINSETKLMKGLHVDRLKLWTKIYNEHFIEHNLAFQLKPRYYTAFNVFLVFWIGFCKARLICDQI